jgi:alpha-1,2-mannosyltransferase
MSAGFTCCAALRRLESMAMWTTIRSGDWITAQRLRNYPLIVLAFSIVAVVTMIAATHDRLGPDKRPLGTDFSQVWVAGLETLRGHPEEPFDLPRHVAEQRAEFGTDHAVYGWHYPPYFLAPAAVLAHLPYLQALLLWQLATLALYLGVLAAITRSGGTNLTQALIAAVAFPAVLINLGHGQNGFLTAALLGAVFLLLEKRPGVAGALLGLLAYKPQFALALPVALLFGRHWRALAAASVSVVVTTALTVAAFGLGAWRAFFESLPLTRTYVIEQGATGFEKIQSVFAAVRLMGGDVPTAYAFQGVVTIIALAGVALVWSSALPLRRKAAVAIIATLMMTPYCLDYDMVVLAPAAAFLVVEGLERGFGAYEKSAMALAFFAPLIARPLAEATPIPLGVIAICLLFAASLRTAIEARRSANPEVFAVS